MKFVIEVPSVSILSLSLRVIIRKEIYVFRNESIEDGVEDKIVDSVCFKSIFMKALLTLGYKIDAENFSKIMVFFFLNILDIAK